MGMCIIPGKGGIGVMGRNEGRIEVSNDAANIRDNAAAILGKAVVQQRGSGPRKQRGGLERARDNLGLLWENPSLHQRTIKPMQMRILVAQKHEAKETASIQQYASSWFINCWLRHWK